MTLDIIDPDSTIDTLFRPQSCFDNENLHVINCDNGSTRINKNLAEIRFAGYMELQSPQQAH